MKTFFALLAVVLLPLFRAEGGELVHPLMPEEQPLAVVRIDRAALFAELLETRQARALGADARDFSGRLPGAETETDSLKGVLAALVDAEAADFWYALLQDGGTLADRTGALGWTLPAGFPPAAGTAAGAEPAAEDALPAPAAEMPGDLRGGVGVTERLASGGLRVVVGRDGAALEAVSAGAFAGETPWRSTLSRFLQRRDGTVGVLAAARPLLGIASLAGGVELRPLFGRLGLSAPDSVQAELFDNGGDLGFEIRLNSLVPAGGGAVSGGAALRQTHLSFRRDALLEIILPAPEFFLRRLPFDEGLFALANLSLPPLVPRTATLSVWRREDGGLGWAAVFLLADREAFRAQFRRAEAWAGVLFALPDAAEPAPRAERAFRVVRAGGREFAFGIAGGEGRSGYFILSGGADDWPDPRTIHKQQSTTNRLLLYRSALDAKAAEAIAEASISAGARLGLEFLKDDILQALPEKDTGYLSIDGEDAVVMSRTGLLPFLAVLAAHKITACSGRLF